MRRVYKIITVILVFLTTTSLFSQEYSDREIGLYVDKITERLKERGLSDQEIQVEISFLREQYLKEHKKSLEIINTILNQSQKASRVSSTQLTFDAEAEKAALKALYDATDGPNWSNKTGWDFTKPVIDALQPGGWKGVTLNTDGSINELNLSNNNLTLNATTPFPDLSSLSSLISLQIEGNKLYGSHDNMGLLTNLTNLAIGNQNFPHNVIPDSFKNLNKLRSLFIKDVGLSNNSDLIFIANNFPNLISLKLWNCKYSGVLPIAFQSLSQLTIIDMRNSDISDISILGNIINLRLIHFGSNELTTIPSSFNNLINLSILELSNNRISNNIPSFLGNLNKLETLYLNSNLLSGSIPVSFQNSKLKYLRISSNDLEGDIPYMMNLSNFLWQNNKFRFIDFEDEYQYYSGNSFLYAPQAKTDTPKTLTLNSGDVTTLTMYEDGRFTQTETYQWYKDNVAIAGATNRTLVLSNITESNAGNYYCIAKHPQITDTSNTYRNLVLQRETITLIVKPPCNPIKGAISVSNCSPVTGNGPSCTYDCGDRSVYVTFNPDLFAVEIISQYSWVTKDPNGNIIDTRSSQQSIYEVFDFTTEGTNTIELTVTETNGCTSTFISQIRVNSCSCTRNNPNSQKVLDALRGLIDYFIVQIDNGKSDATINSTINVSPRPQELINLFPYITDTKKGIYNFETTRYSSGRMDSMSFSFSPDHNEQDVYIRASLSGINLYYIDINLYEDSEDYMVTSSNYYFIDSRIRHLDFCPPDQVLCSSTNAYTPRIKEALANLIKYFLVEKEKGVTDATINLNFNPNELEPLSFFILEDFPKIYHFKSTYTDGKISGISFSFSPDHEVDVSISGGNFSAATFTKENFDIILPYTPPLPEGLNDFIEINNHTKGDFSIEKIKLKHINFCPDTLCKNHVVIVVDESGSISEGEKKQIRRQLENFINKQKELNVNGDWNMYVSFIGMSDTDLDPPGRNDHILEKKVDAATVDSFLTWIDNYGYRYNNNIKGVSAGSDFWMSGLTKALSNDFVIKPKLVIMITDGSQTNNPSVLKDLMKNFNNYRDGSYLSISKPHLYVIGIDNGFYVYNEQSQLKTIQESEDPNLNPSLRSSSAFSRTTPRLSLSLKYLLGLGKEGVFPQNSYDNTNGVPNFKTDDYIGYESFKIFGDPNSHFLSDNIEDVYVKCGSLSDYDPCSVCFSFQPEPGQTYVIDGWVKEELNIQVKNYSSPKIVLRYLDCNKDIIETPISNSEFTTKGEIIEGWQRIGGKFWVPNDPQNPLSCEKNTQYMEFELRNTSDSFPVFFDDIRIYPIKGSVKSFVYDPETFRLMSELDENNYATYYEYDNEGGLVRVKKETIKGVKTIQETRSGTVIKN